MDRWTMRELKETDDITFAIQILNERMRKLTPYSPLGMKLSEAAHTLSEIKAERDRYLERLSAVWPRQRQQTGRKPMQRYWEMLRICRAVTRQLSSKYWAETVEVSSDAGKKAV